MRNQQKLERNLKELEKFETTSSNEITDNLLC